MATVVSLAAKLVNVICFNYMYVCGEIAPDFYDWAHHTAFSNFYGKLIEVPFFGKQYNVIAPLLILVLALVFTATGIFKYNSKTIEGLSVLAEIRDSQGLSNRAKSNIKPRSFVERIYAGEKAILKTYEELKRKRDRRQSLSKHLLYNSILGSFGGDNKDDLKRCNSD